MKFNEDSRVRIPSILHLCRLGYKYISLKDAVWDIDTNIFPDIFKKAVSYRLVSSPTDKKHFQFLQLQMNYYFVYSSQLPLSNHSKHLSEEKK